MHKTDRWKHTPCFYSGAFFLLLWEMDNMSKVLIFLAMTLLFDPSLKPTLTASHSQTKTASTSIWSLIPGEKSFVAILRQGEKFPRDGHPSCLLSWWASGCRHKEARRGSRNDAVPASKPLRPRDWKTFQKTLEDFLASLSNFTKHNFRSQNFSHLYIQPVYIQLHREWLGQILFYQRERLMKGLTSDGQTVQIIFAGFDFQFPAPRRLSFDTVRPLYCHHSDCWVHWYLCTRS